jgi:ribosomal protein L9
LTEKRREKMVMEKEQLMENVKEVMKKLAGLTLEISGKVTGEGKDTLYAALSEEQVIDAVRVASNVQLEKKHVKFGEAIKTLGEHKVALDFGGDNKMDLTVNVVAE